MEKKKENVTKVARIEELCILYPPSPIMKGSGWEFCIFAITIFLRINQGCQFSSNTVINGVLTALFFLSFF